MSDSIVVYAVYYTSATDGYAAGYVWNNIMWNGAGDSPAPSGSGVIADADRKYPIGSIYTS